MGGLKKNLKARFRATNITAVESGLAAVRTEAITTGAPIAEQPDGALFFLDQQGITELAQVKKLKERGLLLKRPLRIDEILKPQSKVPALTRVRQTSTGEKRLIEKQMRAIKNGHSALNTIKVAKKPEDSLDIWDDSAVATRTNTSRAHKPVVQVPAVKMPHAGASYRPTLEEHEKLIKLVEDDKARKMQERARVKQLLPSPQLLTTASLAGIDLPVQLTDAEDEVDSAGDAIEATTLESTEGIRPLKRLKKSERDRRKDVQKKVNVRKALAAESAKRFKQDLHQLTFLARQVRAEVVGKEATLVARRHARKERLATTLKRLGKVVFVPVPVAVNQPGEMTDSLRRMKTEGNLVMDRYKSIQERALIEPLSTKQRSKPTMKRTKMVEPHSRKNFV